MYKIILFNLDKFKFQVRHEETDSIIANSIEFDTEEERDEEARTFANVINCKIYKFTLDNEALS